MSSSQPPTSTVPVAPKRDVRWVFLGSDGLRAGWGILVFFGLVAFLGFVLSRALRPIFGKMDPMHPGGMIFLESFVLCVVLLASLLMSRIEGRPMRSYGLPVQGAFGRTFWNGAFWGLAMLGLVMACMELVHAYTFGTIALPGAKIAEYGALWALGFLLVAFFEEYTFRGYFLYTLTRGIGFWPAAIVTSLVFALAHHGNQGENWMGLAEIVLIAVVFAVSVQRTGSLWWAVGIHMSYDWGESFLFSVPNSGTHIFGHLSNAVLHGSSLLSGGTVGPEASLFNFVGEAALLIIVMWQYPERKYPQNVAIAPTVPAPETVLDLSEAPTGEYSAIPPRDGAGR